MRDLPAVYRDLHEGDRGDINRVGGAVVQCLESSPPIDSRNDSKSLPRKRCPAKDSCHAWGASLPFVGRPLFHRVGRTTPDPIHACGLHFRRIHRRPIGSSRRTSGSLVTLQWPVFRPDKRRSSGTSDPDKIQTQWVRRLSMPSRNRIDRTSGFARSHISRQSPHY